MLTFHDDALRSKIKASPPKPNNRVSDATIDAIAFLPFPELEKSVKDDVEFLKEHPLVIADTTISGWVWDVKDGKISRVV